MGQKISLIVNYRNCLGLYHLTVEQMIVSEQNAFIRAAEFAEWVAEEYLKKGCDHVICIEFRSARITKAQLKSLAETDVEFIQKNFQHLIGKRWEFRKSQDEEVTER